MKNVSLVLSAVIVLAVAMVTSCVKRKGCTDPLATNYHASAEEDDGNCIFPDPTTDLGIVSNSGAGVTFDGYTYTSIVLGNGQEWMAENLKTSTFCNGDSIPNVNENSDWTALTTGAWAYYNNDGQYDFPYGKLYNWFAVNDNRNICPCGWHVPTNAEWDSLILYLDPFVQLNAMGNQSSTAGGKMKSTGIHYWISPNQEASNESGFSGLPGGMRNLSGVFSSIGSFGFWWSSTGFSTDFAWYRLLSTSSGNSFKDYRSKTHGFSVRCIKD